MSGGSLDYLYYKVEEVAGEMHDEELKMLMIDLSDVLHDLEWWTSCDIAENDYRETVKKFKQKWFGVHSNITAEVVNNLCDNMRSTLLSNLVYQQISVLFILLRSENFIGELIYKSNRCDLWLGDCLEVMKEIPDKSVDMILCDLPYGTTACKWDTIIPFSELWGHYNRIIKEKRPIILFASEPFATNLRYSNLKSYKYDWIQNKVKPSSFALAKKQPMRYHENVIVFNSNVYYPMMEAVPGRKAKKGKNDGAEFLNKGLENPEYLKKVYTDKYPGSIITFSNADQRNRFHPTQKPVPLLQYLIKTYTNEDETVLDNCMGSGSTGVAALNTNRRFIGIELDTTYCGIAKQRIQDIDT